MMAAVNPERSARPCPSCGKPIEAVEVCYYCCSATEPGRRITEKKLALWAVAVALLGIALLVWSGFAETPVTPIADLAKGGAFLNFRVIGMVQRESVIKTPYPEADIYSYWLEDGSGSNEKTSTIKLKVEGAVYKRLKEDGNLPQVGQTIDVLGTLYAGDGFRVLSLNSPQMLSIVGKEGE